MEKIHLVPIVQQKKILKEVRSNTWTSANPAARYVQYFCFPHNSHQDLEQQEFE